MAKADAFKPASGSKEVMVRGDGMAGPQLGDHFRVQGQPTPVRPAPMAVKPGGGDQFVPASQPVPLAGAQPPVAGPQQPPAPAVRPEDKFQPASGAEQVMAPGMGSQQPRPFPHREAPQAAQPPQPGNEVFAVSIIGEDASGQQFVAPLGEVEMPRGLKLGARIQPLG